MAAAAAAAAEGNGTVRPYRGGFSSIATACECCGAPSAVYFFNPFRALCLEHSRVRPVEMPKRKRSTRRSART